jgi:hypothetical protein
MKRFLFTLILLLSPLSLKAEPRHPLLLLVDFIEWLQVQEEKESHRCHCHCHCHEYSASKKMKKRSKRAAERQCSTPYAG